MMHPSIDLVVRIARALGAKLKDRPFLAMFLVEKPDELFDGVAVCFAWPDGGGAGGDDDCCWVAGEYVSAEALTRGRRVERGRGEEVLLSVT